MGVDETPSIPEECLDKAIQLERVHFDNITRTKQDALVKEVRRVFDATTFRDLLVNAYDARHRMIRDGLFANLDVTVDVARDKQAVDGVLPVQVYFTAREPSRVSAAVQMGVTNRGEGESGGRLAAHSVFGRGESLDFNLSYGNQKTHGFTAGVRKPLLSYRDTALRLSVARMSAAEPVSSYSFVSNEAAVELTYPLRRYLRHSLRVASDWRTLQCLSKSASFAVREQAGHSLKNSFRTMLTYSTLDNDILPSRGILLRIANELSAAGDANMLRHDIEFKGAVPLIAGFFMSIGAQASLVQPRGSLSLLDRVYLGGPIDLRGFGYRAAGPVSDGAFVGGMASCAAAAHIYRPLFPRKYLFAHAFGVAGNIYGVNANAELRDVVDSLSDWPRCSLGIGIAVRVLSAFRLELNYVWPFSSHPQDMKQPGLQLGVGVNFL